MEEEISPEAWADWKLNPITQALFQRYLPKARLGLMEQWAAGQFQGESRDEVLIRNAAALGQIECYDRLIGLNVEEFNIVINEEEEKANDQ